MSVADATSPSIKTKKRFDIAILFAVCGVLFSLLIFLFMFKQERDAAVQHFHVQAAQDSARFQQALKQNLYSLDSLQAYFYVSGDINVGDFERVAKRIANRSKAVHGIAWFPNTERVGDIEGDTRADGLEVVSVTNAQNDLLSTVPAFGPLLKQVSESASEQTFSKTVLVEKSPYLLVSTAGDIEGSERLVVLINLTTVLQESLLNTLDSEVAIDISVDKSIASLESETQIFAIEATDLANDSSISHVINIAPGKALTLNFMATEAYLSDKMSYTSALFLLTGLLLSFLLASYLRRIGQHLTTLKNEQEVLVEQMIDTSWNDPLTGLVNRIHFDEALETECRRAVREFSPLTMILMRIDDFEPYAEHYGVEAADILLQRISGTLKSSVGRPGDMIARLDNNLFGFILPSTNELVVQLAERCSVTVRELDIPNDSLNADAKVTISAGVATLQPSRLLTAERLFQVSNEQLTEAINEGGDRYVAYAESGLEPSVTYSV